MRAVVQRVKRAEVRVGGDVVGGIGPGVQLFERMAEQSDVKKRQDAQDAQDTQDTMVP